MTHSFVSTTARVQDAGGARSHATLATSSSAPQFPEKSAESNVHSLATLWARKYVVSIASHEEARKLRESESLGAITSKEGRINTAKKLKKNLTLASAKAWSMTETLLAQELECHGIEPDLINPWQIAADSHKLFEKALDAYAERFTPRRLSVVISGEFGQVRKKYTANDPRILGFVSMQFHNTGKMLLESLSSTERSLLSSYFKVMDDHMYIPLRDTYAAAAEHDYNSPALAAVQHLLPISTRIAYAVCEQVSRQHTGYQSYSGPLGSTPVRISSIRDVEMFQVYLCLCVLENSIRAVQQELFPLCVMLYPQLKVSWKLVQDMLRTLSWEIHDRLAPEHGAIFMPYLQTLTEMFSIEVFQS